MIDYYSRNRFDPMQVVLVNSIRSLLYRYCKLFYENALKCQLKGKEQKFLPFLLQNTLKEHKIIHVQSLFTFLGFTILYLTRSSSKLHYSVYGVVNFLLMLRRIKRHVINMLLRGADKAYSRNVKFHVKYNFTTIKGFSYFLALMNQPAKEFFFTFLFLAK